MLYERICKQGMKKTISVAVSLILFVFLLAGCDALGASSKEPQIGKKTSAIWFDFTIKSIERVTSYSGYEASADHELIVVKIYEKNTFFDPIEMGTFDFYLDSESLEEYVWPLSPFAESMMPDDFVLDVKESAEYDMVYEVPVGLEDLQLLYTEIDEEGIESDTYALDVPKGTGSKV